MPITKVTISGSNGAGKSTIVKKLVEKLGWETADVGQIFRKRAIDKGLTIAEYDKLVEKNPQEDIEMDESFKNLVKNSEKSIIVSRRLGFYFLPEIKSIFLYVNPEEGAKRIFNDDRGKQEKKYQNIQEVLEANKDREQRTQKRIQKVYGFDYLDKSGYKKVIDTTNMTIDEVVEEILVYLGIDK